jgi:hypothetical protein
MQRNTQILSLTLHQSNLGKLCECHRIKLKVSLLLILVLKSNILPVILYTRIVTGPDLTRTNSRRQKLIFAGRDQLLAKPSTGYQIIVLSLPVYNLLNKGP